MMCEMYFYILKNVLFVILLSVSKSWSKSHSEMCGDIRLVQPTGIISSPYYPVLYPSKVYCTWHILSPPEHTLKIHVKDFDIPDDPLCGQPPCCHYNFIRLPVSGKVNAYEQMCSNLTQSVISVTQNHTTIVFHYGLPVSNHARGFQLTYSMEKNICGGDFLCRDGTCIPLSKRCDGVHQCPHGEDETSCPGASDCEYKCRTGDECYSSLQRCNGHSDCIDDSDESLCAEELCPYLSNKHLCRNGRCIDADLWCNGNDDCGDFSDEEACLKNSMITVAMMGALLGGLFLVLAVGCSLRIYSRRYSSGHNYQLRLSPPGVPRLRMPHSLSLPALIDNEFFHREPPPMYSVAIGNAGIPRRSRGNRSRSSLRRSNHTHRYTVTAAPVPKPPSDSTLNHSSSLSSEDSLLSSSNVQVTNTDDSEQLISA